MLGALFERLAVRRIRMRFAATERNGPIQELLNGLTGTPPVEESFVDDTSFTERKLPWYLRIE
jgi:hypothetical protein